MKIPQKPKDLRALKGLLQRPGQTEVTIGQMNKAIKKRRKKNYKL